MSSDTSPSEHSRIAELSGNDPYRQEVLVTLTILKERSKRGEEWMERHDAKDERRFAEVYQKIEENYQKVEEKSGAANSSIQAGEVKFSKLDGIKVGIGIAASFFLALGGAIWAVFTFFSGKHP